MEKQEQKITINDNNELQQKGDNTDSGSPPPCSPSLAPDGDQLSPVHDLSDPLLLSSALYFDDIFGPSSTGLVGKQYTGQGLLCRSYKFKSGTLPADGIIMDGERKIKSSMAEIGEGEEWPTNFTTSIYYGGQDVVDTTPSSHPKKKDGDDDNYGTQGDWWKGSYHY
ncbi:hypothetical protein DM860_013581 [Cuscuta australis]|uniref:Uncharacterized protein n=1 Tax=Cuscuta australis TaxID=267555 RepID=A0A328E9Z3_9ASTE|nr:hypothetical protein DM860_013581 [Cuscuta australis]